jgi:hypothetical protein
MLPNKQVYYDARSMNPTVGDTCQVLIQHMDQPPETLTAIYLGSVQLESYTTPYFKFLVGSSVRLICSNSIREWRYTISAPSPAPQLPGVEDYP